MVSILNESLTNQLIQVDSRQKSLIFSYLGNKSKVYNAINGKEEGQIPNCVILPSSSNTVRCFQSTSLVDSKYPMNFYLVKVHNTKGSYVFWYFCRQLGYIMVVKNKEQVWGAYSTICSVDTPIFLVTKNEHKCSLNLLKFSTAWELVTMDVKSDKFKEIT